jgi:hypothetical protein
MKMYATALMGYLWWVYLREMLQIARMLLCIVMIMLCRRRQFLLLLLLLLLDANYFWRASLGIP